MPVFQYTAKGKDASTVNGKIVAQTQDEAIEKISQQGLVPVKVSEGDGPLSYEDASKNILSADSSTTGSVSASKIKGTYLYAFSRQLASLLKAGIPLLRGLEILQKQLPNENLKNIIASLIIDIKNGKTFADSLQGHTETFSSLYVAMIRAGEESGQLRQMLLSMASYQKEQDELRSKVRTALTYPIIMAVLGLGTIVFMLSYVLPKMSSLFENVESLPQVTLIVLRVSEFMSIAWMPLMIFTLILVLLIKQWAFSPMGRISLGKTVISLPFYGQFVTKIQIARFARSMELLLKSGMSILKALQLSVPITENYVIRNQLDRAYGDLVAGQSFGKSLKKADAIPGLIGDLIEVGEESGSLGETLQDIADEYERDVNESIKIMTTLLEPIMIILVGSFVGFIVMAMLLPIFQLDIYSR